MFRANQGAAVRAMIVQRTFMHIAHHEELQPPAPTKIGSLLQTSRAEPDHFMVAVPVHATSPIYAQGRGHDSIERCPGPRADQLQQPVLGLMVHPVELDSTSLESPEGRRREPVGARNADHP
jgi:hypothetical protein